MESSLRKYPSIETWNKKSVERIKRGAHKDDEFVIVEKCHGANFAITRLRDGTIQYQSRERVLKHGDKFYGYENNEYISAIATVMQMHPVTFIDGSGLPMAMADITLFGELYGPCVQRAINYGPDLGFVAFDIAIDDQICSYMHMLTVCSRLHIPCMRPLSLVGDDDVSGQPHFGIDAFESKIRPFLHLEALTTSFNIQPAMPRVSYSADHPPGIAEGIIIRSKTATWKLGGNHQDRPMFKLKRAAFAEKGQRHLVEKKAKEETLVSFMDAALDYVNAARLATVKSNLLEDAPLRTIIELFALDAINDFAADHVDAWNAASKTWRTHVLLEIKGACWDVYHGIDFYMVQTYTADDKEDEKKGDTLS